MRIYAILFLAAALHAQDAGQQPQQAPPPNTGTVIRTETKQVLVDAVVTDKKGNYVRSLSQKSFKVAEDGKDQSIKSFSYEADPTSPLANEKRYLVLFFDNSTMDFESQRRSRDAAVKFIDANVKLNRPMAIANFSGVLNITQNFTEDVERLKQVVAGVKFASVDPNAAGPSIYGRGGRGGAGAMAGFGQRTMLLALRTLAQNLSDVPGRKILVLLSGGFPLTFEARSELTATIDACNKSNVAIYPIDVRGLVTNSIPSFNPGGPGNPRQMNLRLPGASPFGFPGGFGGMVNSFQARGGGGSSGGAGGGAGGGGGAGSGGSGGGGSRGGGGSPTGGSMGGGHSTPGGVSGSTGGATGGRGGTPGSNSGAGGLGGSSGGGGNPNINPNNRGMGMGMPRTIVPPFPPTATTNQEVLYALADGTGGFVIVNTNDLLGGLDKIGKEQNEYYLIGYTPPESAEGSCHTLKVKVEHGYNVRARTGYCNVKQTDVLAGKPQERDLETKAAANVQGDIKAAMETPFFYTSTNTARMNVAMEIPTASLKLARVKGKEHLEISVLGLAYGSSGAVAARFSDSVTRDFADRKEVEAFQAHPLHYENQFDIGSGDYKLTVVFSSGGESFGKLEQSITVDPYDGKQLFLSGIALSKQFHRVTEADAEMDTVLLEGRSPLVAQGVAITPAGDNHFKKTDTAAVYLEIYEPLLAEAAANPAAGDTAAAKPDDATPAPKTKVGFQMRVLDQKTGEQKEDSGMIEVTQLAQGNNTVLPVAWKLPVANLAAGAYRAEFTAADSTGRTITRAVFFQVE